VGCRTENCLTMANIASAQQCFYSEVNNTANASTNRCVASQPLTTLNAIFTSIAASLSTARLIPTRRPEGLGLRLAEQIKQRCLIEHSDAQLLGLLQLRASLLPGHHIAGLLADRA
jgi:hypothetical protein